MFRWVKKIFIKSSALHIRGREIESINDLIDLIDRFLDGNLSYQLEWDDFISWKSSKDEVEAIRIEIESWEHLLFSDTKEDIDLYNYNIGVLRDKLYGEKYSSQQ